MLADATNEFAGQWVFFAMAGVIAIAAVFGIIGYFATSRELGTVTDSLAELNATLKRQNEINEERVSDLHDRINPLELKVGELRGATDSFEKSFEKFTRIIESTSRGSNETISAFTRSLDTFANVVDRATRERSNRQ